MFLLGTGAGVQAQVTYAAALHLGFLVFRQPPRASGLVGLMADEAAAHVASPPPPPATSDGDKARHSFFDFMTKVTQYEELVDVGKRFLVKFHQELEHFRRPVIPMEPGAVCKLVKSNYTDRLKSYLEAGCHLQQENIWNINQLQSCEEKLKDHINNAKVLLEELQCLVKDAYSTTLTASLTALQASDCFDGDNNLTNDCCEEKIVKALCLKTSSSELDGYCLMWDLRPYVDDNVMQLAWKFIS